MKIICPPSHHHNVFMATHELEDMMYGYTLLVPMSHRMLNKLVHWYQQCVTVHHAPNRESTMFSRLHIYYIHLSSVRFEQSVCRRSLMITYINKYIFICIYINIYNTHIICYLYDLYRLDKRIYII